MPVKTSRNQGKGMFVKEQLNNNPLANAEAVNKAWRAAGMSGSISATLVSTVRSRLRSPGNLGHGSAKGPRRRHEPRPAGAAEPGRGEREPGGHASEGWEAP